MRVTEQANPRSSQAGNASLRFWTAVPAGVLLIFALLIPMGIITSYSFLTSGAYGGVERPWTISNYARILDPIYLRIALRTVLISGAATVLCLLLGFPLALFIARSNRKNLYMNLVMLPFWTSFLIRLYAWTFLLRDTGLINTSLQSLGWTASPLPLLYNNGAVLLGLVYGYLPFAVLPIYATLERLDPALLEASADLGATPWGSLWRVTIPLSSGGLVAGAVLVFIPCIGTYLASDLLGGSRTVLIGNLIQNQFTSARDWTFGSALAVFLIVGALVLLWLAGRRSGLREMGGGLWE